MDARRLRFLLAVTFGLLGAGVALGQTPLGTQITYQGQLKRDGVSVTSSSLTLRFGLWTAQTGGDPVGPPITINGVNAQDGLFTVELDFGAAAFDGAARWLEAAVYEDGIGWVTLTPRQQVTATPYALFAENCGNAAEPVWQISGDNIYRLAGYVGIGVDNPGFPLHVETALGTALYVRAIGQSSTGLAAMGMQRGVEAASYDAGGRAVYASDLSQSGDSCGVFGRTDSTGGSGVYGLATKATGTTTGVKGEAAANTGRGVVGLATHAAGATFGVRGEVQSSAGCGVFGRAASAAGTTYGVKGEVTSPDGYAGYFQGRGYFSDRVGIGVTNPQCPLHVYSDDDDALRAESSAQYGWAMLGVSSGADGAGVVGSATNGTGVEGRATAANGIGLRGLYMSTSGVGYAVYGETSSASGYAGFFDGRAYFSGNVGYGVADPYYPVHVDSDNATRGVSVNLSRTGVQTFGGRFETYSTSGKAVYGLDHSTTGTSYGGHFESASTSGNGVFGRATATTGMAVGVYGMSDSAAGYGVCGYVNGAAARAFSGRNPSGLGLYIEGGGGGTGAPAIRAVSTNSTNGIAIYAGNSSGDCTLVATNMGAGQIIKAYGGTTGGDLAFQVANNGDTYVRGHLSKGSGSFKIDHPLDPENKYLYHSFVESPDMLNVYNGNVVLDEDGTACVELPAYFGALNCDFRYQLTAIGAPGPDLHIAEKITNNRFRIAGGRPGMEVSWQVTGIRQDAFARANPIPVEVEKPADERGTYLHPAAWGVAPDSPDDAAGNAD